MTGKTRRRKIFSRRTWLNVNTTLRAHMVGHVEYETYVSAKGSEHQSISGNLAVSDCDRSVTLDFDVYDSDGVEPMREKVQRTRAFVADFCDAMDRALDMSEVSE